MAFLPLLAVALGTVLASCASNDVVLKHYDLANFKQREVVLLLSDSLPVVSHTKHFSSFKTDGIDSATVRHRIDSSFRAGLLSPLHKARIRVDSTRITSGPLDTVRLESDGWRLRSVHSWEGLDSNVLYLRAGPLHYQSRSETKFSMGTVQSKETLVASMNWILYDPREGKAVLGGYAQGSSNTWILVGSIITQGDWYAAARQCGSEISQAVGKRR